MSLTGRVVLVTGGSQGIGRAIILRAAAEGASVVVNYLSNADAAEALVSQIGRDRALAVQADISKTAEARQLVHTVVARFERIDILILNAAIIPLPTLATVTEEQFDLAMAANVKGPCFLVQEATQFLPPKSAIIFISSDVTDVSPAPPPMFLYAATKAALNQVMRHLSQELAGKGIRVNAISPGAVDTELFRSKNTAETTRVIAQASPFQRIGMPDEIAAAVSMLWGEQSRWITGQVVRVNGGSL